LAAQKRMMMSFFGLDKSKYLSLLGTRKGYRFKTVEIY